MRIGDQTGNLPFLAVPCVCAFVGLVIIECCRSERRAIGVQLRKHVSN